jgi:hypothetical protein
MPEADEEYLNASGFDWETIKSGNDKWLLVHETAVSAGYNVKTASRAFRIQGGYPDTQIDMVYFYPLLSRVDGKAIPNLTDFALDGKTWQQWSRHRTSENPWRPQVDDVLTQMLLVEEWLEREFKRRP